MKQPLLLVDGYNMIGSWPELVRLKNQEQLEGARDLLLRMLSHYAKYEQIPTIVVFDAQFVPGIQKKYTKYEVQVVFTSTDETADSYIEKLASKRNDRFTQVTVATSDLAEQWLVFSKGALRKSAKELYQDIQQTEKTIQKETSLYNFTHIRKNQTWSRTQLQELEHLRDSLSE